MKKMEGTGLQECYGRFLVQNECDSSPLDHQPISKKDHFMGTGKIV